MDATQPTPGSVDPGEEVRRLRRALAWERAMRRAAERVGARATADFHESVQELRRARVELSERAEESRVVDELSHALRRDVGSAQLANRVAESVGRVTAVERCDVVLAHTDRSSAVHGTWSRTAETAGGWSEAPELPASLAQLLRGTRDREPVLVDDVGHDTRLSPVAVREIVETLGMCALAAVPTCVGDEVVGWVLLQSLSPRVWQQREIAVSQRLSDDLVTLLVQVHLLEQQQESARRLEELDHAKDAFISTVSHELRTPLTSIVGYLEVLHEGSLGVLDAEVSHGVAVIERNVDRLRGLIEDLLTLSAYDAGQLSRRLATTDLQQVVVDGLRSLDEATAHKDLEVVVSAPPGLPTVLADHDQVARAVHNVLSNAVTYSRVGGLVTVRLWQEDELVVLSVADRGVGISEVDQQGLFTRFFRSRRSDDEEIQGSGLGLAVVQTVVERHGGTVALDSTEGEGTTVTLRLPRSP